MKVSSKGSQNGIDAERKLIIDKYYLYGLVWSSQKSNFGIRVKKAHERSSMKRFNEPVNVSFLKAYILGRNSTNLYYYNSTVDI